MEATDLTIEILKSIRDEAKATNVRLDSLEASLGTRIDLTNSRLDNLDNSLGRRIVESEVRTATAITALAGTVRELTDLLRSQYDLRPRVDKCELEIARLKDRLPDA